MAVAVYVFCALTSLACAALLVRGYLKSRHRLLLWSSLCFVCLAAQNVMLFVDLVIVPEIDLQLWRGAPGLIGLCLFLGALIWEKE